MENCILVAGSKMVQPLWKIIWHFLITLNTVNTWPRNSSIYVRKLKSCFCQVLYIYTIASFIVVRSRQLECPSAEEWICNIVCPYNENLLSCEKEGGTLKTWYSMNDAKPNKPYVTWYCLNEISRIGKSIKTESRLMVSLGSGHGEWLTVCTGYLSGVIKMLWNYTSDSCTTGLITATTESYTF